MAIRTQDVFDLYDAVDTGNIIKVRELLDKGVNPNIPNYDGNYILLHAINEEYTDIAEVLINSPGIDVFVTDNGGYSALHCAALNNNDVVVELLLAKGIDINKKTSYGNTPLHFAAQYGHSNMVKMLLDAGADKTLKNNRDETAEDLVMNNDELCKYIRDYQLYEDIKEPECL